MAGIAAASCQFINQSIKSADVKRAINQSKNSLSINQVKALKLELIDYAHLWEELGALFFSPSKINRAKAPQAAKDEAKELESQNKLLRARDRAARKAQKEAEVRQRREDRAARAAARKAEEALQKAKRQQQREAKAAQKRLETESKASKSRPRKKRKIQKEPKKYMVAMIGSEPPDTTM